MRDKPRATFRPRAFIAIVRHWLASSGCCYCGLCYSVKFTAEMGNNGRVHRTRCKDCINEEHRWYWSNDPERRAKQKAWAQTDKGRASQAQASAKWWRKRRVATRN